MTHRKQQLPILGFDTFAEAVTHVENTGPPLRGAAEKITLMGEEKMGFKRPYLLILQNTQWSSKFRELCINTQSHQGPGKKPEIELYRAKFGKNTMKIASRFNR